MEAEEIVIKAEPIDISDEVQDPSDFQLPEIIAESSENVELQPADFLLNQNGMIECKLETSNLNPANAEKDSNVLFIKCEDGSYERFSKYGRRFKRAPNPSQTIYPCQLCPQLCLSADALEQHVLLHGQPHVCDMCGLRFQYLSGLRVHLQMHGEQRHKCEDCGRVYRSGESLIKHKAVHLDASHNCDICERKFGSTAYLLVHKAGHKNTFKCLKCKLSFKTFAAKNAHMFRVHLHVNHFHCRECGQSFISNARLKFHLRSVHRKRQTYLCCDCGEEIALKHRSSKWKQDRFTKATFSCTKCLRKSAKSRVSESVEISAFNCDTCGKNFRNIGDLENHQKAHLDTKAFTCELCGKVFSVGNSLINTGRVILANLKLHCCTKTSGNF